MSAWYIFSALGFYPVNPVSGEYIVGTYVRETITHILRYPIYNDSTVSFLFFS